MANKTVYPYGTNGSLPSSIGVINDYVTGGADKALSAEVGKTFGATLYDILNTVNLSSLTVNNYSFGNNGGWYAAGKHIAQTVTPGDTIRIKATGVDGYNGGFYAFLTSSYSPPASTSGSVPYSSGWDRTWTRTGIVVELVVPEDAAYLGLCTKDGGGQTTWEMWTLVSRHEAIMKSDVVNNLSDGGEDVPLSAEQGKVLANAITGVIPSGLTKYEYSGGTINFTEKIHHVAFEKVKTITAKACQGGACYGDYLFMFVENNTTCWIHDLTTGNLLQTITIPAEERGFVSNCHCNTVNFGTEKYDADDPFPLIYVSTGYASGGYSGALVYRIVETTEGDVVTYSLTLVQTLKIPGTGWSEFIVGDDGNCFVCITGQRTIYRFPIPKLSDGDITFDLDASLEIYKFSPQLYSNSNQNRMYYKGKIYMTAGASGQGLFVVLDLLTRTRETLIDLNAIGITAEPETNFIWNGVMHVVCRSNNGVYALYFD